MTVRRLITAPLLALLCLLPACRMSHLTGLTITPGAGSESLSAAGQTVQYKAIATYQTGRAQPVTTDVTDSVTWTAANPSVATMSAAGVATAVGPGKTTITAESGSFTASSDIMVAPATAAAAPAAPSIVVTPATATATAKGETTQFLATGSIDGTGTARDLTRSVTWTSSNPSIASVNGSGQTTAAAAGTTTITASANGATASAALTVTITAPSLAVVPANASASSKGEITQFLVSGSVDGTGITRDLTRTAVWTSSNPSVATVNTLGQTTALGNGTSLISAGVGGISASATLTVNFAATPPTVSVVPAAVSATSAGEQTQFIALGNLDGTGKNQNLTGVVSWISSNPSVATVDAGGRATALASGTSTITATADGAAASSLLTVTLAPPPAIIPSTITILPGPGSATATELGEATQFIAIGNLGTDGVVQDLTSKVKWSSSDSSVATIDQNGLATDVAQIVSSATSTTITAEAVTTTGAVVTAASTLTAAPGEHSNLPTLSVSMVGYGQGLITPSLDGGSAGYAPCSIQNCVYSFTLGSSVTLTAAPDSNSTFAGWAANCVPKPDSPVTPNGFHTQCVVRMVNNETVGAIFN